MYKLTTLMTVCLMLASPAAQAMDKMTKEENEREATADAICADTTGRPDHTTVLCTMRDIEKRQLNQLRQIRKALATGVAPAASPFYVNDKELRAVTCGNQECDERHAREACVRRKFSAPMFWTSKQIGGSVQYTFDTLLCKL